MDLRTTIATEQAKLESISFVPTEKDPKAVLLVTADLTPEIAAAIGCSYVFTGSLPQPGLTDVALDAAFKETFLQLKDRNSMRPDLVHKFKVFRLDDLKLGFQCRIHLTGYFHDLIDVLLSVNKDAFALVIEPAQQELPLEG